MKSDRQKWSIEVITNVDDFRALKSEWEQIDSANPMLSWDWMFSWWEAYSAGKELLLVVVRDNQVNDSSSGRAIGILPLYKTVTAMGTRIIKGLGTGQACSDYLSIICDESLREQLETFIARSIFADIGVKRSFSRWDLIELEGHDENSFLVFQQEMFEQGCRLHQQEIEGTWRTEFQDDFAEFESRMRKPFRRKTRKAQKNMDQSNVDFFVYSDVEEIENHWKGFCRLHQMRRRSVGQAGCFADDSFNEFLWDATKRLAENGAVRLARATVDDQDIGYLLVFCQGQTFWMYQSGFDPEFSRWEPGYLVTTGMVKYAIESGCKTYDFLRGDEPYKRFWNTQRNSLFTSLVIAPTASAQIRHSVWKVGKSVKDRLFSSTSENPTAPA